MRNHIMAWGLQNWHTFWSPVKAWAEYHQNQNAIALQFFASLAIAIGLPVLILLILVALGLLVEERIDCRRERARQRRGRLLRLKAELEWTRDAASNNTKAFMSRTEWAWTVLPLTSIEQALIESGSLNLTSEQTAGLHELRQRILKSNSLVSAKLARSTSGNAEVSSGVQGDRVIREIQDQFEAITGLCRNLLTRLGTV